MSTEPGKVEKCLLCDEEPVLVIPGITKNIPLCDKHLTANLHQKILFDLFKETSVDTVIYFLNVLSEQRTELKKMEILSQQIAEMEKITGLNTVDNLKQERDFALTQVKAFEARITELTRANIALTAENARLSDQKKEIIQAINIVRQEILQSIAGVNEGVQEALTALYEDPEEPEVVEDPAPLERPGRGRHEEREVPEVPEDSEASEERPVPGERREEERNTDGGAREGVRDVREIRGRRTGRPEEQDEAIRVVKSGLRG